ncbi:MAG: DUF5668 domain-containing protein [Patescibacteria group bacterium]|jgi:predicted membrane protein
MVSEPLNNDKTINNPDQKSPDSNVKTTNKKKSIFGPLILIMLGLLLLLSNLGIDINWSYVWPILIIIIGLGMIFSRNKIGAWVIFLLIIILILSIIFTLFAGIFADNFGLVTSNWNFTFNNKKIQTTTKQFNIPKIKYDNLKKISLVTELGIGKFNLSNSPDKENYFTSTATYNYQNLEPTLSEVYSNDSLNLDYSNKNNGAFSIFGWGGTKSDYNVNLGFSEIDTDLDLNIGTGNSEIYLNNQSMSHFDAKVGTGEMNVNFSGTNPLSSSLSFDVGTGRLIIAGLGSENLTSITGEFGTGSVKLGFEGNSETKLINADISGGTGELKISVPIDVSYSIKSSVGTGSIKVNDMKIAEDETFFSENYDKGLKKIDFTLEIGTGSISLSSI